MKLFNRITIFLICLTATLNVSAQKDFSYDHRQITVPKVRTFSPRTVEPAFRPRLTHLEAPAPGGDSYRSALQRMKKDLWNGRDEKSTHQEFHTEDISQPLYLDSMPMRAFVPALDSHIYIAGGTPLDNTLAISNDDFLILGVNSKFIMHNLKQGRVATEDNLKIMDFGAFADGITTDNPFDPKLLYDPENDRFIATFLTGRTPQTSGIVLAFSTTNNPMDDWNVYLLPGNPLDDNSWTDYPAFAMTKNELFLTVNLLIPGAHWKVAFKSTVIWQINKDSGYNGSSNLVTELWNGIAHNDRNLRNLCPIQGGTGPQGPNMYLLSNRNFDTKNDSIFLVEVTGEMTDPSTELKVSVLIADQPYGLPPNGRQANSDPNDPADGFDTNDSRILGGFLQDNTLHFVGNTAYFPAQRAGVYHGIIQNISTDPKLTATVIGDDVLDFGYPNMVLTGHDSCSSSALIAFNHTSPEDFAGTSAIRYSDGHYSDILRLKNGEDYVQRLGGSYERWGDYYGIQRKYNEPGVVWTAGFIGRESRTSATWITELRDCNCFRGDLKEVTTEKHNVCTGMLKGEGVFGIEPYQFTWTKTGEKGQFRSANLCDYNVSLVVSDAKMCSDTLTAIQQRNFPQEPGVMYPNPAEGQVSVYFTLEADAQIELRLVSSDGKVIQSILNKKEALAGNNLITFSAEPLASGWYYVQILQGDKEIFGSKLVVP